MIESILAVAVLGFGLLYLTKKGDTSMYKYVIEQTANVYDKYAPYSFKSIRQKVKDMGQEYTTKEYLVQIAIFASVSFLITYLYFYSITVSIIYMIVVVSIIQYLTYLRCKRIYS